MNNYWDSPECGEPHLDAPAFMPAGSTLRTEDSFEDEDGTWTTSGAESRLCERADAFWWEGWNA